MDTDNPNMNDVNKDYHQWWEGVLQEERAKADKMEAEERMQHNKMLDDFSAEASAAGDWTAANWEQFKGKVKQWTNSAEIKTDEAI